MTIDASQIFQNKQLTITNDGPPTLTYVKCGIKHLYVWHHFFIKVTSTNVDGSQKVSSADFVKTLIYISTRKYKDAIQEKQLILLKSHALLCK